MADTETPDQAFDAVAAEFERVAKILREDAERFRQGSYHHGNAASLAAVLDATILVAEEVLGRLDLIARRCDTCPADGQIAELRAGIAATRSRLTEKETRG